MLKIVTYARFRQWWQEAMDWFTDAKDEIIAAIPKEAVDDEIDAMFNEESEHECECCQEATNEDIDSMFVEE